MFVLFEQRFQKRKTVTRVTAFSEQKVFPFNHFRFDSILSFREDTADENLTVVISCVGREANAMEIGGTFNDFMPN